MTVAELGVCDFHLQPHMQSAACSNWRKIDLERAPLGTCVTQRTSHSEPHPFNHLLCQAWEPLTFEATPKPPVDPISALRVWWTQTANAEGRAVAEKAVEYGAYDLELIGQLLREMGVNTGNQVTDAELGCWFYLFGKVARATSAIRDGRRPSDDTVGDAGVYLKMIARIRETGGWPGV